MYSQTIGQPTHMDMLINMRQVLAILWVFELLLYFYQLYYAQIINWVNYLPENVLCSKNDKIVTDILEKLWEQKTIKKYVSGLVKKIKTTMAFNAII